MKPAEPRSAWRRLLDSFRKSYNQLTGKPRESWFTFDDGDIDPRPPPITATDPWHDCTEDGIPYVAGLISVVRPDGNGFAWAVRSGHLHWEGNESTRDLADARADEVLRVILRTAIQ